ncbi:ATP-binding protein, partial [Streptomyces microflavus]
MKKSAAKSLGVAVLGAAFAAAAAGSASAAPALPLDSAAGALPVSTMALDTVAKSAQNAPVQETVGKILGGDAEQGDRRPGPALRSDRPAAARPRQDHRRGRRL